MRRKHAWLFAVGTTAATVVAFAAVVVIGVPEPARALDNGLARTPPMGWNGFNRYTRDVTESIAEAEADALVSSGMKAAGYRYLNLDGGWDLLERNADGELVPDPAKFPHGIKALADYVHSLGLKFGIYAAAGLTNCGDTSAGSYGHYQKDAEQFAAWGVDYVKFDWCRVPLEDFPDQTATQVAQTLGAQMSAALAATGRPIVFDYNINPSARGPGCPDNCSDWEWASPMANVWRVTRDAANTYTSLVNNFTRDVQFSAFAGPGGWNNPDAFEIGNGVLTETEAISQFSLWAELAAPLVAGNDLSTMSQGTRRILTNRAVIAVDQDPLGRQGYPVASSNGQWVLTKPLANGDRAVVLFNQTDAPATITTSAAQVGMPAAPAYIAQNLWTHSATRTTGEISAEVPPHAVVMYRAHVDED